jgi:hypothetical protein
LYALKKVLTDKEDNEYWMAKKGGD